MEWDAPSYDVLALPHITWGDQVLARLPLRGHETVLELGCGTGRDTAKVLARLPRGHVIALDASRRMLAALADRVGSDPRVTALLTDVRRPFGLDAVADAAFTVAALHWIDDHRTLFGRVAEALKPGAVFAGECGGQGNIATVWSAIADIDGPGAIDPWHFGSAQETHAALTSAGFCDVEVALVADPARFGSWADCADYLETVVLGAHLRSRPESERRAYVRKVVERLAEPVVDYVRLQFTAVRDRSTGDDDDGSAAQ